MMCLCTYVDVVWLLGRPIGRNGSPTAIDAERFQWLRKSVPARGRQSAVFGLLQGQCGSDRVVGESAFALILQLGLGLFRLCV